MSAESAQSGDSLAHYEPIEARPVEGSARPHLTAPEYREVIATGRSMFGLTANHDLIRTPGRMSDTEARQLLGVEPKQLGSAGTHESHGPQRAA